MSYRLLKAARIVAALFFFCGLTFLFVDFRTSSGHWWDWFKYSQLIPALFASSVVSIIVLVAVTFLLGRIYCSSVCPLGILQDIIMRVQGLFLKKSRRTSRFTYNKGYPWLRYIVFVAFFVAMFIGIVHIGVRTWAALIDPYSAYGRIATSFFGPVWDLGNNLLADASLENGTTTFWHIENQTWSWLIFGIAITTLLILIVMVCLAGRLWCNTVCPAGTLLGLVSRFSLLAPVIDKKKCVGCRKCERDCKSRCIDITDKHIDYSRCVTCFNCLGQCKFSALKYTLRAGKETAEHPEES